MPKYNIMYTLICVIFLLLGRSRQPGGAILPIMLDWALMLAYQIVSASNSVNFYLTGDIHECFLTILGPVYKKAFSIFTSNPNALSSHLIGPDLLQRYVPILVFITKYSLIRGTSKFNEVNQALNVMLNVEIGIVY